jgi:hypothetical protein
VIHNGSSIFLIEADLAELIAKVDIHHHIGMMGVDFANHSIRGTILSFMMLWTGQDHIVIDNLNNVRIKKIVTKMIIRSPNTLDALWDISLNMFSFISTLATPSTLIAELSQVNCILTQFMLLTVFVPHIKLCIETTIIKVRARNQT